MKMKKLTALLLATLMVPVSYTHLDVYKRQAVSSSPTIWAAG